MNGKFKATFLTMTMKIFMSLSTVVFNLVYINLILKHYGSSVNGLISTLIQFVSMFSILEGGFNTAVIVATYGPLAQKNYEKLNDILYTARKWFVYVGVAICCFALLAGGIYINYIGSPYTYLKTYLLLLICIATFVTSICGLNQYTILLQGHNHEYISSLLALIARTITWAVSILLIIKNCDILLVYSVNFFNVLLNIVFVKKYEKKHYPYATYKGKYNKNIIKGTKDVMFQKIANTIFNATDLVLISVCVSLAASSVYNIYNQIFTAIFLLLTSVSSAPFNSFGQLAYENDNEKFLGHFGLYQKILLVITTVLFTIAGCSILPFINIYTAGIIDYNYIYPSLVVIFFAYYFTKMINQQYGTILNVTGNFKSQNFQCGLGAVLNIVISIGCVWTMGIHGVILGSFVSTLVILIMNIIKAYKYILLKNPIKEFLNILFNFCIALLMIVFTYNLNLQITGYYQWIIFVIIVSVTNVLLFILFNFALDKYQMKIVFNFFLKYIKKVIKN
ncbi:MAG: hypothetical protein A2Y15_02300 [Clostridiales bacterium GWF2_36_10]|nr:MAG: hypothetical protein A2Y15_02300 [Clostridiales bacterium GWF2_36_10]HAN21273.1 hypothetical protein [Clostridiales bacterium]